MDTENIIDSFCIGKLSDKKEEYEAAKNDKPEDHFRSQVTFATIEIESDVKS